MTDLSSVAREAAERNSTTLMPGIRKNTTALQASGYKRGFIAGFIECASRIPNEEEIAEAIAAGYDSVYAHRLPVNEHDLRAARAVRALIGEKING